MSDDKPTSETFERAFEERLKARLAPFVGRKITSATLAQVRKEVLDEMSKIFTSVSGEKVETGLPLPSSKKPSL